MNIDIFRRERIFVDSANRPIIGIPYLTLDTVCTVTLGLFENGSSSAVTPIQAQTRWECVINDDYGSGNVAKIRIQSGISIVSGKAVIAFNPLNSAELQKDLGTLDGKKYTLELNGYTSGTAPDFSVQFFVFIRNRIGIGSVDPQPAAGYIVMPEGGTAGQVLTKTGTGVAWGNAGSGSVNKVAGVSPDSSGNVPLTASDIGAAVYPEGGTAGQFLQKTSTGETWATVPEPQYPVTSVNSKTGAVNITASDVNAISRDGWQITELDGTAVQEAGKVYEHTLAADEVFTFFTPVDGMTNAFELDLTQPATAVSFTLPAVTWLTAVPVFTTANKTYRIMFHRQGSAWMATDLAQQDLSAYAKLSGGNSFSGKQFFSEDMVFGDYGSSITSHHGKYILNTGLYAGISVGTGAKITSSWGGVALGINTSCLGDSGAAFGANAAAESGCVVVGITLKSVGGYSGFYIGGNNGIKFVTNSTNDTRNQFMAAQMLNNGNFNFLYDISVSGTLTFNTTGGTSTTLQALEERVAALEQAQS